MQRLITLFRKYREPIMYIFFGGCTTLVNWVCYWLLAHPLGVDETVSTFIAQVLSVLFAYVTNRLWVFRSEAKGFGAIMKEMGSFFLSRLSTILLDMLLMEIFAKRLGFNDLAVKLVSNVIIIALNYVLSKLLVFRGKKE